jgi:hypothetical protein
LEQKINKTMENSITLSDEICYLDELIIEGITIDGVKFRPSDWVDRLCGMLAAFDNQKMSYSASLRPLIFNNMNCVAVKKSLQEESPNVFKFIMQFATDNSLIVADCAKFKKHIDETVS